MKPVLLPAVSLIAAFAVASLAYAAGPTAGPTLPNSSSPAATPPTDTGTSTGPQTPSTGTTPDTSNPTSTDMDRDRTSTPSHHHRTSYSTHRHGGMHTASLHRYSQQCRDLRAEWHDASLEHRKSRHYSKAWHLAMMGERSCRSHHSATMKTGTHHLRSALRMIGEKPSI